MSVESILNLEAIQALRELSPEGDGEFLRELVAIYLTDTPKQLAQLETALATGDADGVTRAAHTVKGSSGNFGAAEFTGLARDIEQAAKGGDLSVAARLLPELKRQFHRLAAALQEVARA